MAPLALPLLFLMMAMSLAFKSLAADDAPVTDDTSTPRILVLGDSLSAAYGLDRRDGWVNLLQRRLQDSGFNYKVINASVSGDTTRTGLGRLPAALQQHRPAIVIIALGGNDGLRALSFDEIERSLTRMIELSRDAGARVLLSAVRLPPNNGAAYNRLFADIYIRLAERYQLPLVSKMLDQVADNSALMQQDGIHPVASAQPQVLANIWAGLEPLLNKP